MKKRTAVLYLVDNLERGYAEYNVYSTFKQAKEVARKATSLGRAGWGGPGKRLAGLCRWSMLKVFGKRLARKNVIKMTVTIEEVK